MKINKKIFPIVFCAFLMSAFSYAQEFIEPASGISSKKTAYLTLADGTELEGSFKVGQEAINGGYKWISFKPEGGKKTKYQAEEVKSMLVPQSTLSKIGEATSMLGDATKWDQDVKLNEDAIKEGYYYYETIMLKKKKKEILAVRQILNPGYASVIKVLNNKAGMDGPSASIGGIKVAGGDSRSYLIKVGDNPAIKVKAGKYDELFSDLYGSCPEFVEKHKDEIKWSDIEAHVFEFSQMCDK